MSYTQIKKAYKMRLEQSDLEAMRGCLGVTGSVKMIRFSYSYEDTKDEERVVGQI